MPMNDTLLKACRLEVTDHIPVWIMRQAGRYLPEYRKLREGHTLMQLFEDPHVCSEVMSMPVDRFGFDAAVLFADIMLPLRSLDFEFTLVDNLGPMVERPIRNLAGVFALKRRNVDEAIPYVFDAIRMARKRLDVPIIGFCGGPFTVASYMIEGRSTREFGKTRMFMKAYQGGWKALMERLTDMSIEYLQHQIRAGVSVVQLFDSWAGYLTPSEYSDHVMEYSKRILDALPKEIPKIHFSARNSHILELLKSAGGNVIGVDSTISIGEAWKRLGYDVGVQGNLDPQLMLGSSFSVRQGAERILMQVDSRPGFIFNLSHGILPDTPVANVAELVEAVHGYRGE
ncbi:MAG: uroporphyrinogen decarboxylase [Candidatus Micrarchaeota archaeon]|nr:uroporphyrinogen decarboxylase [Candidatus Micrarchaeota archaeon]